MNRIYILFLLCLWGNFAPIFAQNNLYSWEEKNKDFFYTEVTAPRISNVSDSQISIIKLNLENYDVCLKLAAETDSVFKTLPEWSEQENYCFVFNAGMYSLQNRYQSTGFVRRENFILNHTFKNNFNALLAFSPTDLALPPMKIIDLSAENYEQYKDQYTCFVQSIRMIASGEAVYWSPKSKLKCSMLILAQTFDNEMLVLFTRSPYSPNEMIDFMLSSHLNIKDAMYMEGGPEASFYYNFNEAEFGKFGSYVSQTHPTDKNNEYKKMPNVIGLKTK